MITYQQFRTKPDTNGNPRRGWLIGQIHSGRLTNTHRVISWIEEGYRGYKALDVALETLRSSRLAAVDLGSVNVAPSEYRSIREACV